MTVAAGWVLLARSEDDESLGALASCAVAAASRGIAVSIVWDGGALRRRVTDGAAAGAEELERLRREGRLDAAGIFAEGNGLPIRHYACSAAAQRAGGSGAVAGAVDELVGWGTVVGWIADAERTLTF